MKQNVRVWDIPVRLFHWLLVLLVAAMWYTGKQGGDWLLWHFRAGYAIATLLIFRVIWGIIGSETARFTQFIKGPSSIFKYLRGELPEEKIPGHNPVGALMVVALLVILFLQVGSGLLSSDINSYMYDGPLQHLIGAELSEQMTGWHGEIFNILLILISLHVSAVFFYLIFKKTNLILPMLTGIKPLDSQREIDRVEFSPLVIAVAALVVAAGIVYAIVTRL